MQVLTPDELRTALTYDAATGVFTLVCPSSNRVQKGAVAGSRTAYGYISIRVNGRAYQAHRLAWFHAYGVWPAAEIDHINGDRTDNRLANLRDVSGAVNRQNRRYARPDNRCGVQGVRWSTRYQKWEAKLTVNRKQIYIGRFEEMEQAHQAYLLAKRERHEGCTI